MAITAVNKVASNNNGGGASGNTASWTPGANKLALVSIFLYRGSGTIVAPTVTGNGRTYTEVGHCSAFSIGADPCETYLFRALSASPTAGAISISSTGAEWVGWAVDEIDGCDTTGTNGSGAIVQVASNQANSGGALTVTLAAFADAANATYGAVNSYGSSLKGVGTGFTELTDGTDSPQTQFRADNDTTCDWSGIASAGGGVAVEIKVAGAGGTDTTIEAAAASVAADTHVATVTLAKTVSADAASIEATPHAATITLAKTVSAATAGIEASGQTASITLGSAIGATLARMAASVHAAAVTLSKTVTAAVAGMAASAHQATIAITNFISAGTAHAVFQGQQATIVGEVDAAVLLSAIGHGFPWWLRKRKRL